MVYNPQQHHRHSIRLPGYDYTSAGMYYVTIRTSDYKHLFCRIQHGQVILNEIGYIVQDVWISLPQHHAYVCLDAFVIMPNHIHAIIMLTNNTSINHGDGNTLANNCGNHGGDHDGDARHGHPRARDVGAQRAAPPSIPSIPSIPSTPSIPYDENIAVGPSDACDLSDRHIHHGDPKSGSKNDRCRMTPRSLGVVVRSFKSAVTRQVNLYRNTPGAMVWQRNYYEHIIRDEADLRHARRYIADNPQHWRA